MAARTPDVRWLTRPALLAGLIAVALGLWALHQGEPRLALQAFTRVGWALLAVVLLRGVTVLLCGTAWGWLVRHSCVPLRAFQSVRFIREACNVLLPLTAVGGDILGMRLITFWGLSGGVAIASVTVDLTLQASAQALFTLFGLALIAMYHGMGGLPNLLLGGIAVLVAALAMFHQLQRRGMEPLKRLLERLLARGPLREAHRRLGTARLGLQAAFAQIWGDRTGVAGAAALHLAAWLVGVIEVWIALRGMGHPRGWQVAAMLESLSQGLRSLAFPVPAGIGVQEGGLIALGQLLGLEPGTALAISMVKRVPDIALGAPALLAWWGLEARRRTRSAGDEAS